MISLLDDEHLIGGNIHMSDPESTGSSSNHEPSQDNSNEELSNNNMGGNNSDDDDDKNDSEHNSQNQINQEGLDIEAERLKKMAECEHRSFEKGLISYDEDMANCISCDYCQEYITEDAMMCNNCTLIQCANCDHAEFYAAESGDISDEDSGLDCD